MANTKVEGKQTVTTFLRVYALIRVLYTTFLPLFTLDFHVYILIFMTILKIQGKTFDSIFFLSYIFLP
jgi:hypothetical protein